jgi:tetratricopeptide (TPR) repeat protein
MNESSKVFPLGDGGQYGFFVIHQGLLFYADPSEEPQIKIPIRILQDVILEPQGAESTFIKLKIVCNFEIGFEIELPENIAQKAKIWILSILGMSNAAYNSLSNEKQVVSSSHKKTSKAYTLLTFILIIGFVFVGLFLIFKPFFLSLVQKNCVQQNPVLASEYQQQGREEESNGHIASAISMYETALLHHQENISIREDLDRVLGTRIEQNIQVGNFARAKQDIHKLSKKNPMQKVYFEKLRTVTSDYSIKPTDVFEIMHLFFSSAFTNDPILQQELNDKLQLFGQKLEFILQ